MEVNGSKTKAMVIASSTKDQKWDPKLKAGSTPIMPEQKYRFLGTTVPSDLRFKKQVELTTTKCRQRNRVLKCMKTKSWGNSLENQRTIYLVYSRTAMEYNAPAWHPWISTTKEKNLQRIQCRGPQIRITSTMRKIDIVTRFQIPSIQVPHQILLGGDY